MEAFLNYSFRIVIRVRLSHALYSKGLAGKVLAKFLYWQNLRRSVDINPKAKIGPGLRLAHPVAVTIGEDACIGSYAHILQNVTIGGNSGKKIERPEGIQSMPRIGNFIRIGAGAVLAGPISIGDYVIIGANSVLTSDLPDYATAAGIPATIIQQGQGPHSLGLSLIFAP